MQIYDSHFHFDLKQPNPFEDMKNNFVNNSLAGGVLILNTELEKKYFKQIYKNFCSIEYDIIIATLFDYKKQQDIDFIEFLREKDFEYIIKLHPRISNIVREDFGMIAKKLEKVYFRQIIIDAFFYGPLLQNHVGLELAIYLARIFSDKKIIIAHSGGSHLLDCMLFTRELPNVFYDLSLTVNYLKDTSIQFDMINFINYFKTRIMFGSDYPDFRVSDALNALMDILDRTNLSNNEKELLFDTNFRKIYY